MLSIEDVCLLHDIIIDETGGEKGMYDINLLKRALCNILPSDDPSATDFDRGAKLVYSLVKNPPFIDGNKRTAILALQFYFSSINRKLYYTDEDITKLFKKSFKPRYNYAETFSCIRDWICRHECYIPAPYCK